MQRITLYFLILTFLILGTFLALGRLKAEPQKPVIFSQNSQLEERVRLAFSTGKPVIPTYDLGIQSH